MKKIVFILLLMVFSTSAMSAGLCRNTFIPFAKKMLTRARYPGLRWRLFNGTTVEYKILRKIFIDPDSGQVRSVHIGQDKLKMFALVYFNGDISKAYMKVEEALEPAEFAVLGWEKPLNLPASRAVSTEFAVLGWEKPLNLPASSRAVPMRFS